MSALRRSLRTSSPVVAEHWIRPPPFRIASLRPLSTSIMVAREAAGAGEGSTAPPPARSWASSRPGTHGWNRKLKGVTNKLGCDVDEALTVYTEMKEQVSPNATTFDVFMSFLAHSRERQDVVSEVALMLYKDMTIYKVTPTDQTLRSFYMILKTEHELERYFSSLSTDLGIVPSKSIYILMVEVCSSRAFSLLGAKMIQRMRADARSRGVSHMIPDQQLCGGLLYSALLHNSDDRAVVKAMTALVRDLEGSGCTVPVAMAYKLLRVAQFHHDVESCATLFPIVKKTYTAWTKERFMRTVAALVHVAGARPSLTLYEVVRRALDEENMDIPAGSYDDALMACAHDLSKVFSMHCDMDDLELEASPLAKSVIATAVVRDVDGALALLDERKGTGMRASMQSINSVIRALGQQAELERATDLFANIHTYDGHPDRDSYIALLEGACMLGDGSGAVGILDDMRQTLPSLRLDSEAHSLALLALTREGKMTRVDALAGEMLHRGIPPLAHTVAEIVKKAARVRDADRVHRYMNVLEDPDKVEDILDHKEMMRLAQFIDYKL